MLLHATCLDIEGNGLLLVGDSGCGKSGLASELMALGAQLVADDQVMLSSKQGKLVASAPVSIAGKMELRGFGVISLASFCTSTDVALAVRLQREFPERFPEESVTLPLLGYQVPYLAAASQDRFLASKLMIYMKSDVCDPQPSQYTLHPHANRPKTAS